MSLRSTSIPRVPTCPSRIPSRTRSIWQKCLVPTRRLASPKIPGRSTKKFSTTTHSWRSATATMKTASACSSTRSEKTQQGLCACVFDTTDRVQHMFWRYLEEDHPAARHVPQDQRPNVIQELYDRMDKLIGRVIEQIDDKTLLWSSPTTASNLRALHEPERMAASERIPGVQSLARPRAATGSKTWTGRNPRLHHGPERSLLEHEGPRARRHRRTGAKKRKR